MSNVQALVPVKSFADAKSRLEGPLTRAECARLSEEMVKDVLRALTACQGIGSIAILSDEPRLATLAEAATARLLPERPGAGFVTALAEAAGELAAGGARTLLVIPGDLPTLSATDIQAAIDGHRGGITVCPALDGGSNALLLTPPDAIPFLYGPDSAARHLAAAGERGLTATRLELPAFARDIDTPDDVRWLLGQRIASATVAWLRAGGIAERLKAAAREAAGS